MLTVKCILCSSDKKEKEKNDSLGMKSILYFKKPREISCHTSGTEAPFMPEGGAGPPPLLCKIFCKEAIAWSCAAFSSTRPKNKT